jgi:hypothetical protein
MGARNKQERPAKGPGRGGPAREATAETVPEGFDELTFGRVRGWFVFEAGNAVEGVLRDSFTKEGNYGTDTVYKIEVGRMAPMIVDGETDEKVRAERGDVVGLDEKGFLRRLGDVPKGARVYVKCLGKSPPSTEFPQGAYQFKLGVGTGTELRQRPPKGRAEDKRGSAGDDEAPF